MSITIKIQTEKTVDLNAYYKDFPKKLRTDIDAFLVNLFMNGAKALSSAEKSSPYRLWSAITDGHNLTHNQREVRITTTQPKSGQCKILYVAIAKLYNPGDVFTMKDAKMIGEAAGIPNDRISTVLSNLWRDYHIEVSKFLKEIKS
jgi:hypothetical protein